MTDDRRALAFGDLALCAGTVPQSSLQERVAAAAEAGLAAIESIPAAHVLGIQIKDARAQAEADLIDETLHHRLAPGDVDIDLAGLLRHIAAGGCAAPVGVEAFSDAWAARPLSETAQQMAAAARGILDASR